MSAFASSGPGMYSAGQGRLSCHVESVAVSAGELTFTASGFVSGGSIALVDPTDNYIQLGFAVYGNGVRMVTDDDYTPALNGASEVGTPATASVVKFVIDSSAVSPLPTATTVWSANNVLVASFGFTKNLGPGDAFTIKVTTLGNDDTKKNNYYIIPVGYAVENSTFDKTKNF